MGKAADFDTNSLSPLSKVLKLFFEESMQFFTICHILSLWSCDISRNSRCGLPC